MRWLQNLKKMERFDVSVHFFSFVCLLVRSFVLACLNSAVYATRIAFAWVRPSPVFGPNPRFTGRADLLIPQSKAKLDEEADFEVRSAVTLHKP